MMAYLKAETRSCWFSITNICCVRRTLIGFDVINTLTLSHVKLQIRAIPTIKIVRYRGNMEMASVPRDMLHVGGFPSQTLASHLFTLSLLSYFILTCFISIVSFTDLCSSKHNPHYLLFRPVHKFLIHALPLLWSANKCTQIHPPHTHFRNWYRAGTKPTLMFRNITLVPV